MQDFAADKTCLKNEMKMETNNSDVINQVSHNVCPHHIYGYCKFRSHCKFNHVEDICTDVSCDIQKCFRRHPKECSYYREFNYCKFGLYCAYLHKKKCLENTNSNKEVQFKLTKDIQAFSKLCEAYRCEINLVQKEIKILAETVANLKEMTDKMVTLEKRLQDLGDNSVIYFGAIDELEHDVKVLKMHLSRLSVVARPSLNYQSSTTSSSFSNRPV